MFSILERALKEDQADRHITMVYGVRDGDDCLNASLLEKVAADDKHALLLACSKDDTKGNLQCAKGHVQDVLTGDHKVKDGSLKERLRGAIERGLQGSEDTLVLLCGNSNGMGKEVHQALVKGGICSSEEIEALKSSGSYLMELWGE